MKKQAGLQIEIYHSFKWRPMLNEAKINSIVSDDGFAQPSRTKNYYALKLGIENSARNREQVKAIARDIEMQFGLTGKKVRNEIDIQLANVFKWNWMFPNDSVRINVEDGWVTLEGEVHWNYQRQAAKKAVSNITGVKGVTNNITIKSAANDEVRKKDIEHALVGNQAVNDEGIKVKVSGSRVLLKGIVDSEDHRVEAERTAWSAPGVWTVENELIIEKIIGLQVQNGIISANNNTT